MSFRNDLCGSIAFHNNSNQKREMKTKSNMPTAPFAGRAVISSQFKTRN